MKIIYLPLVLFTLIFLIVGCEKSNDNTSIDTNDIADEIALSLSSSNSGLSAEMAAVADYAALADPGTQKSVSVDTIYSADTSITVSGNSEVTYSYTWQMQMGLTINGFSLYNFYYNATLNGGFDALRMSSTDSRTSNWVVDGLAGSSENYVLSGKSERIGQSQSKVRNQSEISSVSEITFSNVKIDKLTYEILEGTLTWYISGTVNNTSYSYTAIVTYLGNYQAILTLAGDEYTINILTGAIDD